MTYEEKCALLNKKLKKEGFAFDIHQIIADRYWALNELNKAWKALEFYSQPNALSVLADGYADAVYVGDQTETYWISNDDGTIARKALDE